MKYRIASMLVGFLSLLLSPAPPAFAQTINQTAPAPAPRLNLSGAAFICSNQVATGTCPDAEFDPALGAMLNAQGTWAANVSLPQGAIVTALRLCGNFNEVGSSITATLERTPLTAASGFPSAETMATIQSSGASNKTQCFQTTKIKDAGINNAKNQYYVVVTVPDNDGVIFTAVQIEY